MTILISWHCRGENPLTKGDWITTQTTKNNSYEFQSQGILVQKLKLQISLFMYITTTTEHKFMKEKSIITNLKRWSQINWN